MLNTGNVERPKLGLTGKPHCDDSWPSTSIFVRRLYNILEDPAVQPILSWSPKGDFFVVKAVNEFSKTILPRLFNHSNFASFVRQLNKYGFHKVRNLDGNGFGEHRSTLTSRASHGPSAILIFLPDGRDALENIKRRAPTRRLSQAAQASAAVEIMQQQQQQVAERDGSWTQFYDRTLRDDNEDLKSRLRALERNYSDVWAKVAVDSHQNTTILNIHSKKPRASSRRQQQTEYQAPLPYPTQSQQTQYGGGSGYDTPAGGPVTPSSSTSRAELLTSSPSCDAPMQDSMDSPFTNLSSSNQSPCSPISPWDFPSCNVYPDDPGCLNGAQSGHDLNGLGNMGTSVCSAGYDAGMGVGSANPYEMRLERLVGDGGGL
ncbi:HSF-type DNA-binding-domain-containing protein [Coprinopsis sp. MPI-PUGE-AT-0042]|nr:HSF-type DNA-binding-domain-containing protein [Coprinopsis sp. MPI-PUGE-AT-0042]